MCPDYSPATCVLISLLSTRILVGLLITCQVYRNFAKGGRIRGMEKREGAEADNALCEGEGGGGLLAWCYTLHLLCWHASITL